MFAGVADTGDITLSRLPSLQSENLVRNHYMIVNTNSNPREHLKKYENTPFSKYFSFIACVV
jgi:hypothetical protein